MRPLVRAEQAVLGAALIDPGQLARISGWLKPAHFHRPIHAALYDAMLKLHRANHPGSLPGAGPEVSLTWVNEAVAEAQNHVRGLTPMYTHTLANACPRPAHAPAYGRMVLEAATQREVTKHAVRLRQAARTDALHGGLAHTLGRVEELTRALDALGRSWNDGGLPRATVPPTPAVVPPAQSASEEQITNERLLLGSLIENRVSLEALTDSLREDDFAGPGHGQLFDCLRELRHRDEPIDSVTVLWEAQRQGLLADGTLTGDRIEDIRTNAGAGSAEYLGERVLRASVLRVAASAARTIHALSVDEAMAPGHLIEQANRALVPLHTVHERWRRLTGRSPSARSPLPHRAPGRTARLAEMAVPERSTVRSRT
ncbi:DnaB-like helicase N-terminal domain-containing protein [Streptomyces carpaticus]|uniref:DnaB-like helicase N-terminal domain-containing protein n=1 Tax=Streptomyces carpaticus TaxID=285558 RepID=A0ABV4ZGV9_9ACTN